MYEDPYMYWDYRLQDEDLSGDSFKGGRLITLASSKSKAEKVYDDAMFKVYVICSISAIGILVNIVVIWVWSKEPPTRFDPSIYLFKALAVSDIIYLFFCGVFYIYWIVFVDKDKCRMVNLFLMLMAFGIRRCGLLLSLILAVIRFIKLFYPQHVRRLLSRYRMKMAVVFSLVFTLAHQTWDTSKGFYLSRDTLRQYSLVGQLSLNGVGYLLPATLQIVLMLAVVRKVRHMRRKIASLAATESTGGQSLASAPPCDSLMQSAPYKQQNTNQFVCVVFAVCFMTFIAHWLAKVIRMWILVDEERTVKYGRSSGFAGAVLSSLNSSVNIVFYLYIPNFRNTLMTKLSNLFRTLVASSWGVTTTTSDDDALADRHGQKDLPLKRPESQGKQPASTFKEVNMKVPDRDTFSST